eukprot:scaffold75678_cov31-Tisochrysis_lutea.AAC.3
MTAETPRWGRASPLLSAAKLDFFTFLRRGQQDVTQLLELGCARSGYIVGCHYTAFALVYVNAVARPASIAQTRGTPHMTKQRGMVPPHALQLRVYLVHHGEAPCALPPRPSLPHPCGAPPRLLSRPPSSQEKGHNPHIPPPKIRAPLARLWESLHTNVAHNVYKDDAFTISFPSDTQHTTRRARN